MTRSLSWILAGATAVSACAGPIETRVQTHQVTAAAQQKQFSLSAKDAVENRDLALARELVAKSLNERGYRSSPDASILVHVALSARPADIAIAAGGKDAAQLTVPPKRRRPFQSCKDQEHRLTISLFDQVQATKLYTGSAAEYHCRGTIAQSVPFLIDSALSGLDREVSEAPQNEIGIRQGIE